VPRFRPVNKRRRVVAVSAVVVVLVGVGAGSAYLVVRGGVTSAGCQRQAYVAPTPQSMPVNVYNSTTQGGLAQQVADQLQQRGFKRGTVGNDPLRRKIRGTGELRYNGPDGLTQVNALLPWNLGMAPISDRDHATTSVDFVIGDSFTALNDAAKAPPGTVMPCVPSTKSTS
jgi:hypothetical protein